MYRELVERENKEFTGRHVEYKGTKYTVVGVDYNGGILIDKKDEYKDDTAVYRFDKDLKWLD